MQAARPRQQSYQEPKSNQPAVVIAVGIALILAVVVGMKTFRGSSPEDTETSVAVRSHPRGGLKLDNAQRSRVEGGGWVAEGVDTGDTEHAAGSVPPRVGGDSRAGAEPGSAADTTKPKSDAVADSAAARQGGRPADATHAQAGNAANPLGKTGTANDPGSPAPLAGGGSALSAPPMAGSQAGGGRGASAPASGNNSSSGNQPAAPRTADTIAEQGTTLFDHTNNPACQGATCAPLPADSQTAINVGPGQSVISGNSGALSFWLQPQWEAGDTSNATLVQLGNGDTPANRFEIYKNGQSLGFNFADNSGVPVEVSAAIDSWQPGEQHLVTASWSQGQDGQGQLSFYVDGKLAGEQPYSGALEFAKNMPLTIGSNYGDGSTVPGVFGPFHLYKNPLTPGQIAAQAAAPPK